MREATFDWGIPPAGRPGAGTALLLFTVTAALAAGVGVALALLTGLTPWVGLGAGAAAIGYFVTRGRSALRQAGARRTTAAAEPRLASLVEGLAGDLGTKPPQMWIYGGGGPNALACRAGGGAVAVSRSAVEDLTRTELEALVAHCLIRLSARHSQAAAVGSVGSWVAERVGVIVGTEDDARTAALTRYPPAIIGAIRKSEPARGRFAPFYFAAEGPSHTPAAERMAALVDL
jgi:Zn-dependent protease with chaperone function